MAEREVMDTPTSLPLPRNARMSDDITLGELGRRITDIQRTMHDLGSKLDRDYVRTSDLAALRERVESIESTMTWLWRLVGGVVIVGLLGLLMTRPGGVL
jgi:hypothetical protein